MKSNVEARSGSETELDQENDRLRMSIALKDIELAKSHIEQAYRLGIIYLNHIA